jgi:hypothetical protein
MELQADLKAGSQPTCHWIYEMYCLHINITMVQNFEFKSYKYNFNRNRTKW